MTTSQVNEIVTRYLSREEIDTYSGFHRGQRVKFTQPTTCEGQSFRKGHTFTILSFPPKTTMPKSGGDRRTRFVHGIDSFGNFIRTNIVDISKL